MQTEAPGSVFSQSGCNSLSAEINKMRHMRSGSVIDRLFPIYDQMHKYGRLPPVLTFIFTIWLDYQYIYTALWPRNHFYSVGTPTMSKVLYYMAEFAWFFPPNADANTINGVSAFLIILSVLEFILLFTLYKYYNKNHQFVKWTLYPAQFFLTLVPSLIVHPLAALTGYSLMSVAQGVTLAIGPLIFGIICYAWNMFLYILHLNLESKSLYINLHSVSTFLPEYTIELICLSTLAILCQFLVLILSQYTILIIQIAHFVLIIFIMLNFLYLPMIKLTSNILLSGLFIACACLDLTMVILYFYPNTMEFTPIIVFIISFVIADIVMAFVLKFIHKRIVTGLNNPEVDYDDLTQRKKKMAITSLTIGFSNHCENFLNWSLMKYVVEKYPDLVFYLLQLIAYFPSENRKMTLLYNQAIETTNIHTSDRYLLYQITMLKTLRQFSSTYEATEKLNELKEKSQNCEREIRSLFVPNASINLRQLEETSKKTDEIRSVWNEALINYPNSSKFADEYTRFLVECETDFVEGMKIKSRSELIECGKNYAVDYCFRYMVRAFPDYLKKGILDHKGNFIDREKNKKGSSSSSSGALISSGNTADTENEEKISKQYLTYGKLRIALHRSIQNRMLTPNKILPFATVIMVLAIICVNIGMYFYLNGNFQNRKNSMNNLILVSQTRFYFGLAMVCAGVSHAIQTGRGAVSPKLEAGIAQDASDGLFSYLDESKPFEETMIKWMVASQTSLLDAATELSIMANQGLDIYSISQTYLQKHSNFHVCMGGEKINVEGKNSITEIYSILYFIMGQVTMATNDWYQGDEYCMLSLNYYEIIGKYEELLSSIHYDQLYENTKKLEKSLKNMQITVPIFVFVFSYAPITIIFLLFYLQVNKILKVLNTLEPKIRAEARKMILKEANIESDEDVEAHADSSSKCPTVIYYMLVISAIAIAVTLIIWGMMNNAQRTNKDIEYINYWQDHACARIVRSVEALQSMLDAVKLNGSIVLKFTNQFERGFVSYKSAEESTRRDYLLANGDDESPPLANFDDELDDLNFKEACTVNTETEMGHELFRCASITQGTKIFANYISDIIQDIESLKGDFNDDRILFSIHMSSTHLWAKMFDSCERLKALAVIKFNQMISASVLYMIFDIICSLLIAILCYIIYNKMKLVTKTILIIFKRLSPIDIVNNKNILTILLNHKDTKENTSMGISRGIIHNSIDSIICTSLNGIIEIVNPMVTTAFGYKPEQLLGQHPSIIFADDDIKKIENQFALMAKKESAATYEDHLTCVDDSGIDVPCMITLMMMKKPGTEEPHSFVMILKDERELAEMQKEAEESKMKSEQLLYQILPRDIVIKLNSGEKEISFSVPSASIVFIDIQKFSEYAAGLAPSEIMEHLSTVFAGFDQCLTRFNLITKIKLIGDIYMAASGLFVKEGDPPQNHADQIIRFGLDCLSVLEEINVKLNANLAIRIGINSGGPLIAGVLGTDKPVFDIIGDPINVAARLQTTDEVGKIHISQNTFDLIQGLDFSVEQRGEVYLKGKGKTMTYYVLPQSNFFINSITNKRRASISITSASLLTTGDIE